MDGEKDFGSERLNQKGKLSKYILEKYCRRCWTLRIK